MFRYTTIQVPSIALATDLVYNTGSIDKKGLTRSQFSELLKLATENVVLRFGSATLVQSDGVAMGSPLGPILANILCHKSINLSPTKRHRFQFLFTQGTLMIPFLL